MPSLIRRSAGLPSSTVKPKAAKKQGVKVKKQSLTNWRRFLRPKTPGPPKRKIDPYQAQKPLVSDAPPVPKPWPTNSHALPMKQHHGLPQSM